MALALIAVAAPAQSEAAARKHKLRVMTRNLYLGQT
jgi:hypothetical protein